MTEREPSADRDPADPRPDSHAYCPSAQPEMAKSVLFGVVGGTADHPRVRFLGDLRPVTQEILALTEPVEPTEVFRFGAPCAQSACQHYDGTNCRLAQRVVGLLPIVTTDLPPCRLRSRCLWFKQEGGAACQRCPQVVTLSYAPTERLGVAANPDTPVSP